MERVLLAEICFWLDAYYGHFDGDDFLDVVLYDINGFTFSFLPGLSDGHFGSELEVDGPASDYLSVSSFDLVDISGNGIMDLLICNEGHAEVWEYESGGFSLMKSAAYPVGSVMSDRLDVSLDGRIDVVLEDIHRLSMHFLDLGW